MKKPSLFVIGAPKCGTTALCAYLASHPAVCFSEPKEAKYFHSDFANEHRLCTTEDQYLKSFAHQQASDQILAEGTVWYLFSQVAVKQILAFNPSAKFVVMLRNPVDLSYSLHGQLLYGGDEDVADFTRAWQLQEARAAGRDLPRYCRDPKSVQYSQVASLGEQVQRLLQSVPKERVLFLVFDDFIKDAGASYRQVLEFAGLEDDGRQDFPKVNENRVLRPGLLPKVMFFAAAVKRRLGLRRSFGVWKKMQPALSETKKRAPMDLALRTTLQNHFAADVALLSQQVGRDLSHWCVPTLAPPTDNVVS
jgi:hypothetical protein